MARLHSFLAFSRCRCVDLVFGNAFPALQFCAAPGEFSRQSLPVGREPFILLAQHLKRSVNDVIGAALRAVAQRLGDAVLLIGIQVNVMRFQRRGPDGFCQCRSLRPGRTVAPSLAAAPILHCRAEMVKEGVSPSLGSERLR